MDNRKYYEEGTYIIQEEWQDGSWHNRIIEKRTTPSRFIQREDVYPNQRAAEASVRFLTDNYGYHCRVIEARTGKIVYTYNGFHSEY